MIPALCIAEKKREVKGKGEKEKEMATHSSTLAWKIPWTEVHDIVQEAVIKTIPRKKNAKRPNGCLRRPYK